MNCGAELVEGSYAERRNVSCPIREQALDAIATPLLPSPTRTTCWRQTSDRFQRAELRANVRKVGESRRTAGRNPKDCSHPIATFGQPEANLSIWSLSVDTVSFASGPR